MISIGVIGSASGAAAYYAKDNYYTGGEGEGLGQWYGNGAASAGLEGPVASSTFEAVLAGDLGNGAKITTPSGKPHRAGLDLVFSAPKSLSVLALVGGDQRLVAALEASTRATLEWVEANLIEARAVDPASGRQVPVKTRQLVAALFTHDLSRNRDPQLHVHAVLANATRRADGSWRALHNEQLYREQGLIGAVHNADLRARIEALGYETRPAEKGGYGQFEIAGVPREVLHAFSTRSREIEEALAKGGRGEGSAAERELAALATRSPKDTGATRTSDREAWAERAAGLGFDARAMTKEALARSTAQPGLWERVSEGVKGIGAKGRALAEAMGLAPRDKDPLVPERTGRLDPTAYASAEAVAAAARHLGEHEAGYSRFALIKAALSFAGPIKVADIEARIATLEAKRLLLADKDGTMLTTEAAVTLEREVLALWQEGRGIAPALGGAELGQAIGQAAKAEGLPRLSPAQTRAAEMILGAKDRIVGVQGVAGAGKSTMLRPVARLAEAEGRSVIALAVGSEIARKLGDDLKVPATSVAAFLTRHMALATGEGSPEQRARSLAELKGTLVLVDEASTLSSRQSAALMRLAQRGDVARLALIGDTRQYGAVQAGKPFADLQQAGLATARLDENVRARSELMRSLAPLLDAGKIEEAMDLLAPVTTEASPGAVAAYAVARWAELAPEERATTLIITSGRAMRAEVNQEVQAVRRANGELGPRAHRQIIYDRVNLSREEARTMRPYQPGRLVAIRTDMPRQGLAKGTIGRVLGADGGEVRLQTRSGEARLTPLRLATNLKEDAVQLYEPREILLHADDRIRFTSNNHRLGLLNAQGAVVTAINDQTIALRMSDGRELALPHNDPALRNLDLAYAINAYAAQGITTEHGIIAMDSRERNLASWRTLLVAATRIVDKPQLVVDNSTSFTRSLLKHPADKVSALDVLANRDAEKEQTHMPEKYLDLSL